MSIADRLERRLRQAGVGRMATARWSRLESTLAIGAIARREREIPYWPLDRIHELQRRRLRELLAHARASVPFYRQVFQERGLQLESFHDEADLVRLPQVDGPTVASDPMRFVSESYEEDGREVFHTSGSASGVRRAVYWDPASLVLRSARSERDRVVIAALSGESWTGVVIREFLTNEWRRTLARWVGVETDGHQRLLILPGHSSSRSQRAVYHERMVVPRQPVHYHHLPPSAPFEAVAAHLRAIRPRVVLSFGSYVDQFLRFLDASSLDVPLPRVWIYMSDRVSPGGRELAAVMGCTLYSVYAATEAGPIGFQCERCDGFHLNIDLCPVRIVDDDGRDVADGEVGNVVISPLDNRAMVLFNYWVGDRGAISREPCVCGRTLPLLSRMDGRQSEVIVLADGRRLSSLAIDTAFRVELQPTVQAQLEQVAVGHLRWSIVPYGDADREVLRRALVARGRYLLGADTALEVEFLDRIPSTSAGKFMRVRSASPVAAGMPDRG